MAKKAVKPVIGAELGGGFFGGETTINGEHFALIVSPKATGEKLNLQYKTKKLNNADGTNIDDDGFYNSCLIDDANHPASQFCRSLRIGGHDDWYLPSRDELMLIWIALGPNRRNTPDNFKAGGAEAFDITWYWSSTEHAQDSGYAWIVGFSAGFQGGLNKSNFPAVRAVRRLKL